VRARTVENASRARVSVRTQVRQAHLPAANPPARPPCPNGDRHQFHLRNGRLTNLRQMPPATATARSARRPISTGAGVLPRRARTATASAQSSATTTRSTGSCGWPWATRLPSGAALTSRSSTANGEGFSLAKCWRNDAPRRGPHTFTTTWTKSKLSITWAGVETGEPTEEKETTTLEADSPEECDAWDVWVDELKSVRELLRSVWTAAETVPI
jgi:hypothetical protein